MVKVQGDAVPAGMVLVPREPTEAMVEAIEDAWAEDDRLRYQVAGNGQVANPGWAERYYKAALTASPKQAPVTVGASSGEVERFVIRRNGAFFRPNAQGYTTHIIAAGFYTREEADSYASVEGVTIEPLERYRAEAERTIAEAKKLLAALSAFSPLDGQEKGE